MTSPHEASIYVMADLGHRHGGDFDLAIRMVGAAARAGVNAVVMDQFRAEQLARPGRDANYRELKEAELRQSQFRCLWDLSHELGIDFVIHPLDGDSLQQSWDHTDGVWIEATSPHLSDAVALAVDQDRTTFVATTADGLALLRQRLITPFCHPVRHRSLSVLQICSCSFAPFDAFVSESSIQELRNEIGCGVGITDETESEVTGRTAAGAGAEVICRSVGCESSCRDDQRAAVEQFARWVGGIREVESMRASIELRRVA